MLVCKNILMLNQRTFKNFGHKRQPTPVVTVLWHGFLTFTFIGLGIEWNKMKKFIFGTEEIEAAMDNNTESLKN